MNADDYLHSYKGNDPFLQYFTKEPFKHWHFDKFARHFSGYSKKTLNSNYGRCVVNIDQDIKTPAYVKDWIKNNASTNSNRTPVPTTSTTYHIGGQNNIVNHGNDNVVSTSNQSPPPQQRQKRPNEEESMPSSTKKRSITPGPSSAAAEPASVESDDEERVDEATVNIAETLDAFLSLTDFTRLHKYRLESHGIMQIGHGIPRQSDVPAALYDSFTLENKPPCLLSVEFNPYLQSTLLNDTYGTSAAAANIFSTQHLAGIDTTKINYITRVLFIISENIHCRDRTSKITDSEVSYCHYALWPLVDLCCVAISNLQCEFKVGETLLSATKQLPPPSPTYLADGTAFVKDSGLEVLLFEASGKFGTRDRARHTKDHIKGAYGCYSMINAILSKYPYGDKELINDLRVLFLHSSGKDDCVRLWVMRPRHDGRIITFERMDKVTITINHNDKREAIELINFIWKMKGMLELSLNAINNLKASSDANFILLQGSSELNQQPLLPSLLKAEPLKPVNNQDYVGIINLDPVSSLF